jgi:hypothetical protein
VVNHVGLVDGLDAKPMNSEVIPSLLALVDLVRMRAGYIV